MRIEWNDRSIRWFRDASEYTKYNQKLSQLLLPHIKSRETLCDMGCGAGLIDIELAKYVKSITCVDINAAAARSVAERAAQLGLCNITALCADASGLEGSWDTVIGIFYGGIRFFHDALPRTRERAIMVTYKSMVGKFGPPAHKLPKRHNVEDIESFLSSRGIRYHLYQHVLEHGQPLLDREDARSFVRAYTTPMSDPELERYLDSRLISTGDPRYPLYLPKEKELGIFVVDRAENEPAFALAAKNQGACI